MSSLANIKMRHAVNVSVSATVKSNDRSFHQFKELVSDPVFPAELQHAIDNPLDHRAKQLVARVIGFINLSARSVPWGSKERAAEMTKLIAHQRTFGPGSIFYSIAPDDVKNLLAMRLSHPYTGPNTFPATCPDEYLQALHGQGFAEQVQGEFDCSEHTLQELASANPVAGALAFDALIENVRTNLF